MFRIPHCLESRLSRKLQCHENKAKEIYLQCLAARFQHLYIVCENVEPECRKCNNGKPTKSAHHLVNGSHQLVQIPKFSCVLYNTAQFFIIEIGISTTKCEYANLCKRVELFHDFIHISTSHVNYNIHKLQQRLLHLQA